MAKISTVQKLPVLLSSFELLSLIIHCKTTSNHGFWMKFEIQVCLSFSSVIIMEKSFLHFHLKTAIVYCFGINFNPFLWDDVRFLRSQGDLLGYDPQIGMKPLY